MTLYPFQQRVMDLILAGKSVILQAPTGSGKTRAALAPFVKGFFELPAEEFPRKCLYSVPMRVLAKQFFREYSQYAQTYHHRFGGSVEVAIQTGEQPDDPEFTANLIFATIDQSLSAGLGVPYGLSQRKANLTAGAFYSSYLVFDEFHLFPVDNGQATGAQTTTLQLLTQLKGMIPFVLMTATFSSTMLGRLAVLLDAEVVAVSPEEYQAIASAGGTSPRQRQYTIHDEVLSAEAVLAAHRKRTLVVCNQVERAQRLAYDLRQAVAGSDVHVELLHSRFLAADREQKEEMVTREFGKESALNPALRSWPSAIVVATQVIEVGLDLTCEHLYTEVAPANAVFQRAGRCARFPGEQGVVHLYQVPEVERKRNGESVLERDYLPYDKQLAVTTWESLSRRNGQVLDFQAEQAVIDEVHTQADAALLDAMERQSAMLWDLMRKAMVESDAGTRRDLVRRIDNIHVLASTDPNDMGNPFKMAGFGLFRATVGKFLRQMNENEGDVSLPEGENLWLMKYPEFLGKDPEYPDEEPQIRWHEVNKSSDLQALPVVVVNSAFVHYDADTGFRIVHPSLANGWQSPPLARKQGRRLPDHRYDLERYEEHIQAVIDFYTHTHKQDYAYLANRLPGLDGSELDRAVRAAIAMHDVGKMSEGWQTWSHAYQRAIGEPISDASFMAVHTHSEPYNPMHKDANKLTTKKHPRPPHAGESAWAVRRVVAKTLFPGNSALARAVLTAIARHHSPSTASFEQFRLHKDAAAALSQALAIAGLPTDVTELEANGPADGKLDKLLISKEFLVDGQAGSLLLYLLIVRSLRLCDVGGLIVSRQ